MLFIVTKAIDGSVLEYLRNLFCIMDYVNNLQGMNTVKLIWATPLRVD